MTLNKVSFVLDTLQLFFRVSFLHFVSFFSSFSLFFQIYQFFSPFLTSKFFFLCFVFFVLDLRPNLIAFRIARRIFGHMHLSYGFAFEIHTSLLLPAKKHEFDLPIGKPIRFLWSPLFWDSILVLHQLFHPLLHFERLWVSGNAIYEVFIRKIFMKLKVSSSKSYRSDFLLSTLYCIIACDSDVKVDTRQVILG